ncbi:hypothetical protein CR513_49828, partial [Mucuna pruriens]
MTHGFQAKRRWKTLLKNSINEDPYEPFCLKGVFPILSSESKEELTKLVTLEEVKNMILKMRGSKVSRQDVVGKAVVCLVEIFTNLSKVEEINNTFINLIPNIECVQSMKNCMPISLCNDIVKLCSFSFIPNRKSSNNIIITHKVFYSMLKRKDKIGWMAIKIDRKNTCDRLSWPIIYKILDNKHDRGACKGLHSLEDARQSTK